MKKVIVFAVLAFLAFASIAAAGDYDYIMGGAVGYLSSYSAPALFFQAQAGDHIILAALPQDYASTVGFCGLMRMGAGPVILSYWYSTSLLFYSAPVSDLYLFLCVKSSGLSGNILMLAVDNAILGLKSSSSLSDEQSPPAELVEALQAAMNKQMGQ